MTVERDGRELNLVGSKQKKGKFEFLAAVRAGHLNNPAGPSQGSSGNWRAAALGRDPGAGALPSEQRAGRNACLRRPIQTVPYCPHSSTRGEGWDPPSPSHSRHTARSFEPSQRGQGRAKPTGAAGVQSLLCLCDDPIPPPPAPAFHHPIAAVSDSRRRQHETQVLPEQLVRKKLHAFPHLLPSPAHPGRARKKERSMPCACTDLRLRWRPRTKVSPRNASARSGRPITLGTNQDAGPGEMRIQAGGWRNRDLALGTVLPGRATKGAPGGAAAAMSSVARWPRCESVLPPSHGSAAHFMAELCFLRKRGIDVGRSCDGE